MSFRGAAFQIDETSLRSGLTQGWFLFRESDEFLLFTQRVDREPARQNGLPVPWVDMLPVDQGQVQVEIGGFVNIRHSYRDGLRVGEHAI